MQKTQNPSQYAGNRTPARQPSNEPTRNQPAPKLCAVQHLIQGRHGVRFLISRTGREPGSRGSTLPRRILIARQPVTCTSTGSPWLPTPPAPYSASCRGIRNARPAHVEKGRRIQGRFIRRSGCASRNRRRSDGGYNLLRTQRRGRTAGPCVGRTTSLPKARSNAAACGPHPNPYSKHAIRRRTVPAVGLSRDREIALTLSVVIALRRPHRGVRQILEHPASAAPTSRRREHRSRVAPQSRAAARRSDQRHRNHDLRIVDRRESRNWRYSYACTYAF